MTEQEWLDCTDPGPMLEFLKGKASERKLRLFAVACQRSAAKSHSFFSGRIEIVERYSDGLATEHELRQFVDPWDFRGHEDNGWYLLSLPEPFQTTSAAQIAHEVAASAGAKATTYNAFSNLRDKMGNVLASLLHDIFGNSFRPVTLDRTCLTPTVVSLAQEIYDDRAFDRLSRLADALEEAGCTDPEIPAHCRVPGPHFRGCWVVDLVLGKE